MAVAFQPKVFVRLPGWVPDPARNYLIHTVTGISIRALARAADVHASTILRQVRRFESRRDDPLVDGALRDLARLVPASVADCQKDGSAMKMELCTKSAADPGQLSEARIEREALRILRRLIEPGAVLAVARDMEMAVVVRDGPEGGSIRTAVVDCRIAQAMALRDWIACGDPTARIARYRITGPGRSAMKRMMAASENRAQGFAEAPSVFGEQHRDWAERDVDEDGENRSLRYNASESPLTGLARRKDRDGKPFLSRDLVAAGERLREDFELAQIGPAVTQDWERVLSGAIDGTPFRTGSGGSSAARDRVVAALADLGPGLADVALRCCCFLEGLEQAEKRMGWAARSGKIVLRIALQRLKKHYDDLGHAGKMIG